MDTACDAIQPLGLPPAERRFQEQFRRWFWDGIALSGLLHVLLFLVVPDFRVGDWTVEPRGLSVVEVQTEIDIPPPPAVIQRPAVPVPGDARVSTEITIAPTTFEANPVENLSPPPEATPSVADQPVFTPYEVRPEIRDPARAIEIVYRHWPEILRQAGIAGRVDLLVFIDERGQVRNHRVQTSSGDPGLDAAAVAALYEIGEDVGFTPALNRDRAVPVWIRLPIVFHLRT
jgi:TonB family protein